MLLSAPGSMLHSLVKGEAWGLALGSFAAGWPVLHWMRGAVWTGQALRVPRDCTFLWVLRVALLRSDPRSLGEGPVSIISTSGRGDVGVQLDDDSRTVAALDRDASFSWLGLGLMGLRSLAGHLFYSVCSPYFFLKPNTRQSPSLFVSPGLDSPCTRLLSVSSCCSYRFPFFLRFPWCGTRLLCAFWFEYIPCPSGVFLPFLLLVFHPLRSYMLRSFLPLCQLRLREMDLRTPPSPHPSLPAAPSPPLPRPISAPSPSLPIARSGRANRLTPWASPGSSPNITRFALGDSCGPAGVTHTGCGVVLGLTWYYVLWGYEFRSIDKGGEFGRTVGVGSRWINEQVKVLGPILRKTSEC